MASQPILQTSQPGGSLVCVPMAADKWLRVAGYLIDVLPASLISLLCMIPALGINFAALLLIPYWLLRDVAGASLGKLLLSMRIVGQGPASTGARLLRNLPLMGERNTMGNLDRIQNLKRSVHDSHLRVDTRNELHSTPASVKQTGTINAKAQQQRRTDDVI